MAATDTDAATGDTVEDTPEEAAFRQRVREFLEHNAPRRWPLPSDERRDEGHQAGSRPQDNVTRAKEWQARLFDAGLAALTWPTEYGGQGLPSRYQTIFAEEAADYELPGGVFTIGFGMCIPTILTHGTEEQKKRYVPRAARGDEVWCQLFSEPGAGSDVASLQTRAVKDGDEWVLNGQKVWTSGAHYCDYGILIARTNPDKPKHRGITMFIVDMHAPGVEVQPLRQITGGSNFNEVFFTDVRVPDENVVGEVDEGWRCAITTLMNERVAIGAGGSSRQRDEGRPIDPYIDLARRRGLDRDPVVRQRIAELYTRQRVVGFVGQRIRDQVKAGKVPGPEGSIAKLMGALNAKIAADLGAWLAGVGAQAWDPEDATGSRWAMPVVSAPGSSIAGGTNEVMRNILGERVLGLPKEPQVDRDVPFREILVGTQRRPVESP